ncbi:MAG: LicD family protein [Treponema sp.]|nr:LicD family protein [Treponema sp.]
MKELTLQEIQAETLIIMKVIHKICTEQNLRYSLFYGTLLGAVRHKGFIPWDDDLDIVMPRKDYEKLAEYFKSHADALLPFKWFSYETVSNYPYMIARVCNTDFRMEAENEKDCGMGTFVDIYPMDGAGNGRHNFFYNKAWFFSSMYFTKSRLHYVVPKRLAKKIVKGFSYLLSKIYTINQIRNKLLKFSKKYYYEDSEYIASLTWLVDGKKNVFEKTAFRELVLCDFEDTQFYIPKKYDELLTIRYGDYMRLPPENERVGHHFYKIFRKEK